MLGVGGVGLSLDAVVWGEVLVVGRLIYEARLGGGCGWGGVWSKAS